MGAALVVAQDTTVGFCVCVCCCLSCVRVAFCVGRLLFVFFYFLFYGTSRRGKTIDSFGLGEPGGSCMEMKCLTPCLLISLPCDVLCVVFRVVCHVSEENSTLCGTAQSSCTGIISKIHELFLFLSHEQEYRHGRPSNGAINPVASGFDRSRVVTSSLSWVG